jgi:hypothetical protein
VKVESLGLSEKKKRYWGPEQKGIGLSSLDRRNRAKNILNNLGYVEASFL